MATGSNQCIMHWLVIFLLVWLSGCTTGSRVKTPSRVARLQPVTFSALDGWHQDQHIEALNGFKKSCSLILQKSPHAALSPLTKLGGVAKDWRKPCLEATLRSDFSKKEAKNFFEKWFVPYAVSDKNGNRQGRFTGYYEIELLASLKQTRRFKHPVYMVPPNINKLKGKASFTHAAINRGILAKKNLEIAWVDNRARLFLMHLQGAGVLRLDNGKRLKVGFANHNGYSYRSIHSLLTKHMGKAAHSMPEYLKWLEDNPQLGRKVMEHNPSYVFFKVINGRGPIGGHGVPLTSERSLAIDALLFPYGAPIWVQTKRCGHDKHLGPNYHRLFVAQDTGGAIKGAIRGDIFFGSGHKAELMAASMNRQGSYFILLPKTVKVPAVYHGK